MMRIDQPCPMYLSRKNNPDSYYCKSCCKSVIDFRGKSQEEIAQTVTSETCGIFSADQLTDQPTMKVTQRILFTFLSIVSFFGISVSPVNAQSTQSTKTQQETTKTTKETKRETKESKNMSIKKGKIKPSKKRRRVHRKGQTSTMGCPAF